MEQIPGDDATTVLLAILPALFAERAESALVIGLGTWQHGRGAGAPAGDGARDRCEISPAIVAGGPDLRCPERGREYERRRSRSSAATPIATLRRSTQRFDLIVSEPSNRGERRGMLFSREFLQAAKEHLAPGRRPRRSGPTPTRWTTLSRARAAHLRFRVRSRRVWFGLSADPDPARLRRRRRPHRSSGRTSTSRGARDERVVAEHRDHWTRPRCVAHEVLPEGVLAEPRASKGISIPLLHPLLGARPRAPSSAAESPAPTDPWCGGCAIGAERSLLRQLALRSGGACPTPRARAPSARSVAIAPSPAPPGSRRGAPRIPDRPRWLSVMASGEREPALPAALAPKGQAILAQLLGTNRFVGSVSLDDARFAAEAYARYYTHAEPFLPRVARPHGRGCDDGGRAAAARASRSCSRSSARPAEQRRKRQVATKMEAGQRNERPAIPADTRLAAHRRAEAARAARAASPVQRRAAAPSPGRSRGPSRGCSRSRTATSRFSGVRPAHSSSTVASYSAISRRSSLRWRRPAEGVEGRAAQDLPRFIRPSTANIHGPSERFFARPVSDSRGLPICGASWISSRSKDSNSRASCARKLPSV